MIYDRRVDTGEIARLLRPYVELTERQLAQTSTYIDVLLKWNARVNLTSVREPAAIVTRHFGESFFAAKSLVSVDWTGAAVDVGSGAGFPGIPLAMYAPEAKVTLIESQGKKAAFLNEVIHALGLSQVKVFSRRAEEYAGSADLVTMRAVEKFERALPEACRLVAPGGCLALMIGDAQIGRAIGLLSGLKWDKPIAVPGSERRVLLTGTRMVTVG